MINYSRNEVIIKKKNTSLDLTIRGGVITKDIRFSINSDAFYIDDAKYNLSEVKTMYIFDASYRCNRVLSLEIEIKGKIRGISIPISDRSESNMAEIEKMFDYFIFSNENSLERLKSDLYVPMLEKSAEISKARQYEQTDVIKEKYELDSLINYVPLSDSLLNAKDDLNSLINNNPLNDILLNDKYILYKILPKECQNKFSNKKYMIYESKFLNNSYVEIWETIENKDKKIRNVSLLVTAAIIIASAFLVFKLIDASYTIMLPSGYDVVLQTNIFMPLFWGILVGLVEIFSESIGRRIHGRRTFSFREWVLTIFIFILAILLSFPMILGPLYVGALIVLLVILTQKKNALKKFSLVGITVFLVFNLCTFFYDLLAPKYEYQNLMVKNEQLSMIEYKYCILKDMIAKETAIGTFNEVESDYVRYKADDNLYCSKEPEKLVDILQELGQYEEEVTIEYYLNSGVIKSIDGIEKEDYETLNEKLDRSKINKKAEKEKQLEEKRNIENKVITSRHEIMSNAVGKKEEDIREELDKNEVTGCEVRYISSKKFDVGTVAFARIVEPYIYYVVKDNSKEDMVERPKFFNWSSKEDVIQVLEDSGLDYEIEYVECDFEEQRGKLHSITYGGRETDNMLPKGNLVNFRIYE